MLNVAQERFDKEFPDKLKLIFKALGNFKGFFVCTNIYLDKVHDTKSSKHILISR